MQLNAADCPELRKRSNAGRADAGAAPVAAGGLFGR